MKSYNKLMGIFSIAFGIILVSSFIIYLNFSEDENPKNSDQIHIIGNSGWVEFRNAGNCTGSGTVLDPYVIKDLIVKNLDTLYSKYCIWIEDSSAYFVIKDCILSTPFYYPEYRIGSGIKLVNVANFQLVNNICFSNGAGISLYNCNYGSIVGNYLYGNDYGLRVENSKNINLKENNLEWNSGFLGRGGGIVLLDSWWINSSGNLMNECGLKVKGSVYHLNSYNIDTTNLVNGNPLYYYINQINLGPLNFSNAGQVLLVNCSNPLISNLNISSGGIALHYCNNNTISGNLINTGGWGTDTGIYLYKSNKNIITQNSLELNCKGISISISNFNIITKNIVNNNYKGIYLNDCRSNIVSLNNLSENCDGIDLDLCKSTNISKSNIFNNTYGIMIWDGEEIKVSGNILDGNLYSGISFSKCIMSSATNNTVKVHTLDKRGISLARCIGLKISGNILNEYGLALSGSIEELSSHNIDPTNLVNGKPIYYYTNEKGLGPANFTNGGQVILANCNDSVISKLNLSQAFRGISLLYCNNNTISGNTANNNYGGLYLEYSDNNNISANIANDNYDGIILKYSDNNNIAGNTANNNYFDGIILKYSDNNNITGNTANNNKDDGIYLDYSDNNFILANNINNNMEGIIFYSSSYNTISNNILIGNNDCFTEKGDCIGNIFENNICSPLFC